MMRLLLLLPAALLCLAAAPAPKGPPAKTAPAKAAPAKPSAPGATGADAPGAAFDATNPQGIMDILGAAGAKVQTGRREQDAVFITVTSTAANFSMQFAGCSPQGRACRAVLLDSLMPSKPVTSAQVNAFNQTSVMCRIYLSQGGNQPHVLYSAILLKSMRREDAATHLLAWQGCLADASDFLRDPVTYLSNAA